MATIINPITTALMSRAEFESKEFDRFPFKYILEDDGTISYFSKLSAGRFIFSHEAKISGLGTVKTNKAPEVQLQYLAHGRKVPGIMFQQIRQFFLDVMGMGPSTYEAQVFIVWNDKTEEYRIIVPKQTVSAAAVRYDIGDLLGEGDTIIVDIHSHNNMNAFFSGTDNNDDKKNPWISGVFGKLSTVMENKFRFNDGCGRHFEIKAEDVFDFDEKISTPSEWLAQVEISKPVYRGLQGQFDYKNGAGERSEAYKSPYASRSGASGWVSPNTSQLEDFFGIDDLFESEDGDLYDSLVDELSDLNTKEAVNVLNFELEMLSSGNNSDIELTEREASALTSLDNIVLNSGDLIETRDTLEKLLKSYESSN